MNTPTPRTDAALYEYQMTIKLSPFVDFARQLETDLAAAQERIRALEGDAARYRWLSDELLTNREATVAMWEASTKEMLDAAIDAARKEAERG